MNRQNPSEVGGKYLYVHPLESLEIEMRPARLQIDGWTIMSRASLLRYLRKQRRKISDIAEPYQGPLRTSFSSYAIKEYGGKPAQLRNRVLSEARDAIALLACCLSYQMRRGARDVRFGLKGEVLRSAREDLFLGISNRVAVAGASIQGAVVPFVLHQGWRENLKNTSFGKVLKACQDHGLSAKWREQIRRSAIIIGRSVLSDSMSEAFLNNIFALETLLTRKQERNAQALWERIEGLSGWFFRQSSRSVKDEIQEMYDVRCEIVHDAQYRNMTPRLLLLSDEYATNILVNVARSSWRWKNKQQLIDFCENTHKGSSYPKNYLGQWQSKLNQHSMQVYESIQKNMMPC